MPFDKKLLDRIKYSEEELVDLLVKDIKNVFSTMLGMELLSLPKMIDPVSEFEDSYTAMIGLTGECNGLLSLHIPSNLAKTITANMLAIELEDVQLEDVTDALGEVVNMVGGSFKHHLAPQGTESKLSIPSIVSGKEYVIAAHNDLETVTLLFSADEEEWFMTSIVLKEE